MDAADRSLAGAGDLHFTTYQGAAGLEQLGPAWNSLAESLQGARFHHFPAWYRAYLASNLCEAANVWFVAAYRNRALVGVFPLQLQVHRVTLLRPRFLGTIDDDELQLSDFVFERSAENANLLCELTRWLRGQHALRWDVLRLLKVPADSSLAFAARHRLPRLAAQSRYDASAYFDTSGSYEHATRAMSNKFRSNLRRRTRLAESSGPLRFQPCRRRDELDAAFELFLEIEASGWKGHAGTSSAIRCRPKVLEFYTQMVREFATRDECVINLLWHGDRAIAAQLGLQIGRTLHILKVGYRDEKAIFAPGILLQERTIRHACEDPRIDVLSMVNDPYWARSFRPQRVEVCLYYAANWSLRGLIAMLGVMLKRTWKQRFSAAIPAGRA